MVKGVNNTYLRVCVFRMYVHDAAAGIMRKRVPRMRVVVMPARFRAMNIKCFRRPSELARRRADRGNADFYVAPRTSFRVLGPRRLRSARNNSPGTPTDTKGPPTTTVVFNVSQNPPSGQLGPWGAKKEQKDSHNERS